MRIYKIRIATDHEWQPCIWCGRQLEHGESLAAFCDDNGFNVSYWICYKCSGELLDMYTPDEFKDDYDPNFIVIGECTKGIKAKKIYDGQIEIERMSRFIEWNQQENSMHVRVDCI